MAIDTTVAQERAPSPLKLLHETQTSAEKFRIQLGNRISAISRGVDQAQAPVDATYVRLNTLAEEMEHLLDEAIGHEVQTWPVYQSWLCHVRGIGPALSGRLLAILLPPLPEKGVSSWYKAAGLIPELREQDGQQHLERARKGGGKLEHHRGLRKTLWLIGKQFVRQGGYYRAVYDRQKERLSKLHEGDKNWAPWRLDSVARWLTVKLFLSHLWEAWCEVEKIPMREPYAVAVLGQPHHRIPMPIWDGQNKM